MAQLFARCEEVMLEREVRQPGREIDVFGVSGIEERIRTDQRNLILPFVWILIDVDLLDIIVREAIVPPRLVIAEAPPSRCTALP